MKRVRGTVGVGARFPNLAEEYRLGQVPEAIDREVRGAVTDVTNLLYANAMRTINKRTGETARKIYKVVRGSAGGPTGYVGAKGLIPLILEDGSRAHKIPKTPLPPGEALQFRVGGKIIYRRQVNHPGTRPYRWLKRAYDLTEPQAITMFDRRINRALEGG